MVSLVIALHTAGLFFPALAEQLGSLTMEIPPSVVEMYEGETVEMSLYKIAERHVDPTGAVSWGIDVNYESLRAEITEIMDDLSMAQENAAKIDPVTDALTVIISEKKIAPVKKTTMSPTGTIVFRDLPSGLYYMEMSDGPSTLFIQSPPCSHSSAVYLWRTDHHHL